MVRSGGGDSARCARPRRDAGDRRGQDRVDASACIAATIRRRPGFPGIARGRGCRQRHRSPDFARVSRGPAFRLSPRVRVSIILVDDWRGRLPAARPVSGRAPAAHSFRRHADRRICGTADGCSERGNVIRSFVFQTACVTDVGLARELNEDNVLALPDIGLWAVADGMGGHGGGDVASSAVVAALRTLTPAASASQLLAEFEQRIVRTNADLRAMARTRAGAILGTTLVALLVHGSNFACVWCGDSRVYLRRAGILSQVSRDHSEVQELIDRGLLSKEEAMTWARRNVVTRALGATDEAELEIVDGPAYVGDRFLLCSDGLTVHVSDEEIAALLGAADPQRAVDDMLRLTLERGASDNVSIVVVDCEEPKAAQWE